MYFENIDLFGFVNLSFLIKFFIKYAALLDPPPRPEKTGILLFTLTL